MVYEEQTWELTDSGFSATDTAPFTVAGLVATFEGATERNFESWPGSGAEKRRLTETRIVYRDEAATGAFVNGAGPAHDISGLTFPSRKLVHQAYQLAFPFAWISGTWGSRVTDTMLGEAGYVQPDGADTDWFRPSGTSSLGTSHFYLPGSVTDPFGQTTTIGWDEDDLFPTSVTDALGNTVSASIDYQALVPTSVLDPNGQEQAVALDALGRVTKTAVIGKNGEGDTLADPSTTLTYDLDNWPVSVRTRAREEHAEAFTRWQEQIAYSDGGGHVVLAKIRAWKGLAAKRDPGTGALEFDGSGALIYEEVDPCWIGSGRVLVDNKGQPVRQYEPFFTGTDAYEDEPDVVEQGVSSTLTYDPLGRAIRTDHPDGTFERVIFDPWHQETWDRCDNIDGSAWESARDGSSDPLVQRSLAASQAHADTPGRAHFDTFGGPFRSEETPFAAPRSDLLRDRRRVRHRGEPEVRHRRAGDRDPGRHARRAGPGRVHHEPRCGRDLGAPRRRGAGAVHVEERRPDGAPDL